MRVKTILRGITLAILVGLSGCGKDNSETQYQSFKLTHQGIVTGVDNENASFSHGQMAFVLNNKYIFGSPNLYERHQGHSWAEGPAGMMGLSARLKSAQDSNEVISVTAVNMSDESYRIVEVAFPGGTRYKVSSSQFK